MREPGFVARGTGIKVAANGRPPKPKKMKPSKPSNEKRGAGRESHDGFDNEGTPKPHVSNNFPG
jgi:hypothetical protein